MKAIIKGNEITKALRKEFGWKPKAEIKKGDYIIALELGIGDKSPFYHRIEINYKDRQVASFTIYQCMLPCELAKIINKFLEF